MCHLRNFLLAALAFFCHLSFALSTDKDQPMQLAADSVDVDEAKGTSIYQGDVELRQGSIHIQAERVLVKHQDKAPNKIFAQGSPVRFSQKDDDGVVVKARALRAEYTVNSAFLVLIDQAQVTQNGDTLRSDRITYDRVQHKVKAGAAAKGKQRVQITIQPKKN